MAGNPLCAVCQSVNFSRLFSADLEDTKDQATVSGVTIGSPESVISRTGCPLCGLVASLIDEPYNTFLESRFKKLFPENGKLVELIPTHYDGRPQDPVGGGRKPYIGPPLVVKRLGVRLRTDSIPTDKYDPSAEVVGQIMVYDEHAAAIGITPVTAEIDYGAIKSWVGVCEQKHDNCWRLRVLRDKWPTIPYGFWVIDIETRRIVPADHKKTRYVALSYVWGPSHGSYNHFSTLVEDSAQQQQRYVPLPETLPQTLADAMEFCTRVGERYIWIDALCIDQRDAEMKATVIGNMHLIYMGATFTLITIAGGSADAGLPGVRADTRAAPVVLPSVAASLARPVPTIAEALNASVWKTRGWTYQEGCLATRCIVISRDEVFFRCLDGTVRESLSADAPEALQPRRDDPDAKSMAAVLCAIPAVQTFGLGTQPYAFLDTLLEAYYHRTLSYESDRLNAISGVLFALPAPFRFWYGLPSEQDGSLAKGLMWTGGRIVHDSDAGLVDRGVRKHLGIFPSVSWADWDFIPRFAYLQGLEFLAIADVSIPEDSDAMELIYRGHRTRLCFRCTGYAGEDGRDGLWQVDAGRHPGASFVDGFAFYGVQSSSLGQGLSDDELGRVATEGLECLYLGSARVEYQEANWPNVIIVLVVRRCEGWVERLGVTCLAEPAWLAASTVETQEVLR